VLTDRLICTEYSCVFDLNHSSCHTHVYFPVYNPPYLFKQSVLMRGIPTGPRQDVFTGALEVTLVAIKGVVVRITPCPACLVFRAACLFLWTMESTEIRNLIETPSGRVAILTTVCAGMHTVWDLGNTPAGTELH
uniref:Uncharacterized protein n=1 Tax=Cyprinus carpio TaxID=7962 RepID=A0A8C1UZD9_CYPCA